MGRAKGGAQAVAVDHFEGVLGLRRGAPGDERLARELRLAAAQCVSGDERALARALIALRLPNESAATAALQQQLRATLIGRLTSDAYAGQLPEFREAAHLTGVTAKDTERVRITHNGEALLHIVDDEKSLPFSPRAYCGAQLAGEGKAPRGAWKTPSLTPFCQQRCGKCAEVAALYPELAEDRDYPLFESAPARARIEELSATVIDGELAEACADPECGIAQLRELTEAAVKDTFLRVLAGQAAASSEEKVRALIGERSAQALSELVASQEVAFAELLDSNDWLALLNSSSGHYADGSSRFNEHNLLGSVRAKMRETLLKSRQSAV